MRWTFQALPFIMEGAAAWTSEAASLAAKPGPKAQRSTPNLARLPQCDHCPTDPPCCNYQLGSDKNPGCGQGVGMFAGVLSPRSQARVHCSGPRWAPSCAVWQPRAPCFSIESLSFLSPCPLTSPPNAERTPGIKYKSSTNRKQRLETELQPLPKPGNSSALVLGARDFKLHICAVWLTGCTFFSVRLKTGSAYATRVPLGSETHIRLHTGCTVD